MNTQEKDYLEFHGGPLISIIPFGTFLTGCFLLSCTGYATFQAYWVIAAFCVVLCLLLARSPQECFYSIIKGTSTDLITVVIFCWIFSGIFAGILKGSGLTSGLIWLGGVTHLKSGWFIALSFLLSCIYSTSTGTGSGTVLMMTSLLYPAGIALGAHPLVLGGSIISGGCFGDNLSPISDTTIVATATMGVDIPGVMRSRIPYTLTAGSLSLAIHTILGFLLEGNIHVSNTTYEQLLATANPRGLIMLFPATLVVVLAIKGVNLVLSMTAGGILAISIGIPTGLLKISDVLKFENGTATGSVVDGISGFSGLIIFIFLSYALSHIMTASGAIDLILEKIKENIHSTQQAELINCCVIALSSLALCSTVASQIIAGPIMKGIADKYDLSLYRTANFSDAIQAMFSYTMPWGGPGMVFCATSLLVAQTYSWCPVITNPVSLIPFTIHAFFIGGIFLFSAITGIGRKRDQQLDDDYRFQNILF